MNKSLYILATTLGFLGCAVGLSTSQPAHARGVYHVIKSKTVSNLAYHWNNTSQKAYLWNANLTKRLHHLTNYPNTTWYATKAFKMTNGQKTGLFYYVRNGADTVKGYVWQGYLSKDNSSSTKEGDNNANVTKGNPGGIPFATKDELIDLSEIDEDDDDYYDSAVTSYQDAPVMKQFEGTTRNTKLDDAAAGQLGHDFDSVTRKEWGDKLNQMTYIKNSVAPTAQQSRQLALGQLKFSTFVRADLKKQHINLAKFQGWQIGMTSQPIYSQTPDHNYSKMGDYTIALLAPANQ